MRPLPVYRLGMIFLLAALLGGQPPVTVTAAPALAQGAAVTPMVTTGMWYTCGLMSDGSIACWGYHTSGPGSVPAPNSDFTQISAGYNLTCGLKSDGSIVCWSVDNGQSYAPSPNSGFTQVSTGGAHICGLKSDGSVACWGSNGTGQSSVPSPNSGFTQVSAGGMHTCGLKSDGSITCWGENRNGQSSVPAPNSGFTQVSAGDSHTCGLKSDGSVTCWGSNSSGMSIVPAPNSGFTQVSIKASHSCGLKSDGSIVCWGSNYNGELTVPAPNSGFAQVSAGIGHTCGMKAGGAFICWGYNEFGQAPVISVPPLALAGGQYGAAYSQTFSASGGTLNPTSYTWDVMSGALPNGVSLSPGGVLSGTPTQPGTFTFWARAQDDNHYMGASQYTLTVDKAALAFIADPVHSTYGSTPALTYTIYGFVNGDTAEVLSGAPAISTSAGPTSPAGDYPISIGRGTLAAANYNLVIFTSAGHMVTVDPALLTVRAVDKSKLYGANTPLPTLEYAISGFVNGELQANVVSGEPLLSTPATAASPIGEYGITVTQNSDDAKKLTAANYTFAFVSGKLTITGFKGFLPFVDK